MMAEDINRVGWPKPNAIGEQTDVSDVKAEVTQVYGRLNFEFSSIDKKQPAK